MIVEVDFRDLVSLLKGDASLETIINALDMFGTPIDEFDKDTIRVEVFPNRPDMLSTEGIARALNGFLEFETGLPNFSLKPTEIEVKVNKSKVRPFVSFSSVYGIKFNENSIKSIMQMQEKLHTTMGRNRKKYSIGLYDLDKIKPPITYQDLPLKDIVFTPLGEKSDMTGKEILENTEKGKKYAHLVGDKAPVLMDSTGRIMSMAPIINADWCKVTTKTKNVFIDSTGTSPGTDLMVALIATSLAERGARIGVVLPGPTYLPTQIKINKSYIRKLIGLPLKDEEIKRALEKMRFGLSGNDLLIPPYRSDIMSMMDIAEEVAIGYGYEKFQPEIPSMNLIGQPLREAELENKIRELLVGFGFNEVMTFVLTSPTLLKLAGGHKVEVSNPKSREYSALRNSILPGLFDILRINKDVEYPQKIFEIGEIFVPEQRTSLAGLITHKEAGFAEVKAVVDSLMEILGVEVKWNKGEHPFFMKGRTAVSEIGVYGEVNLKIAEKLGMPIAGFELDLSQLK